ncbi:hypothetical protein QLL95_gp0698 [Cotonvirus japonicus]|uniref:Uncharacterized protein n=1 Tax=Cotonvirus japonicus TaxID=2811091 RepID=A0ABM7NTC5_9VIRU|nr:hypothetical protein QLL95_gp0698 [Cotonvirus japonicus]BCS83425.1 hypothetical protein [Cotonvirus japonicus]
MGSNYQPSDWQTDDDTWSKLNAGQYDRIGYIEGIYDEYDRTQGPRELAFAGVYAVGRPPTSPVSPVPSVPAQPATHTVHVQSVPQMVHVQQSPPIQRPPIQRSRLGLTFPSPFQGIPVQAQLPVSSAVPTAHLTVPGVRTVSTVPVVTVHNTSPATHVEIPTTHTVEAFTSTHNIDNLPVNTYFNDSRGRRCRIICDPIHQRPPHRPPHRPSHRPLTPEQAANVIHGRHINDARRIYPNVRVTRANGRDLPTTMDFRPDRINVATRNNVITEIIGFY